MFLFMYIAVTGIVAVMSSQGLKVIFNRLIGKKKVSFKDLHSDGDFPSSHTAYVCSISMLLIIYTIVKSRVVVISDEQIWILVILLLLASFIIRDAVGFRYVLHMLCMVVTKLIKIIIILIEIMVRLITKMSQEIKIEIEELEKLKLELDNLTKSSNNKTGHQKYEVVGGAIWGCLVAFLTSAFYYDKLNFLFGIIPVMIIYIYYSFKLVESKRADETK